MNIEEGDIANAFQQVAAADREKLLPLAAWLKALKVPGADAVVAHLEWVEGILEMSPDDCVKTLAGEGKSYLEGRKRATTLETLASDSNLQTLDTARRVLNEQWPVLAGHSPDPEFEKSAKALTEALAAENALEQLEKVRQAAEPLANEYAVLIAPELSPKALFPGRAERVFTFSLKQSLPSQEERKQQCQPEGLWTA